MAEDFGDEDTKVAVWPDNRTAALVFLTMQTQWLYAGMNSVPTGLNYASLPEVYRALSIKKKDRPEVFANFRVIEISYLSAAHKSTDKEAKE
jgi:hypothetical protein